MKSLPPFVAFKPTCTSTSAPRISFFESNAVSSSASKSIAAVLIASGSRGSTPSTAAKNSYSTLAGAGTFEGKDVFDAAYKKEYGIDATGYAGQGYACAQVVLDALKRAAATSPADMAGLREAVRVAGTDTSVTYALDVGKVTFNADGDTSQLIVSIYSVDPAGANGKGDWKFETQVDYAK